MFGSGRTFTTIVLAALAFGVASASSDDHDPHNVTRSEGAALYPLACRNAAATGSGHRCSALIGYHGAPPVQDLDLATIAYGSFTAPGANQAYVTYSTMFEPHANNFGGGILFERSGAGWKLVRWYPGGQMDRCVAVPGGGKQRMLCLWTFLQEGELQSEVHVLSVPASNDDRARTNAAQVLISVEDTRDEAPFLLADPHGCGKSSDYKTSILDVEAPKRSMRSPFFAQSGATYVTGQQWYDACKTRSWSRIKGHPTTIRYALKGGQVTFASPIAIAAPRS